MIFVNNEEIIQNHFPDGTLNIKFVGSLHNNILWNYENDAELFTLMCIVDQIREGYPDANIYLRLPYLPHARMDRVKNPEDVFTLRTFCKSINAMNFNAVYILDPHSNVGPALLERCVVEMPEAEIDELIEHIEDRTEEDLAIFFPDEGARKRYETLVGRNSAFGIKKRDWETGKIKGLDIFNADLVKDKNVLIIDDICSYGGTFYHSAKALKEAGAKKIYLYITHCEQSIWKGDLPESGLIEHVYTTPTIYGTSSHMGDWVSICL